MYVNNDGDAVAGARVIVEFTPAAAVTSVIWGVTVRDDVVVVSEIEDEMELSTLKMYVADVISWVDVYMVRSFHMLDGTVTRSTLRQQTVVAVIRRGQETSSKERYSTDPLDDAGDEAEPAQRILYEETGTSDDKVIVMTRLVVLPD